MCFAAAQTQKKPNKNPPQNPPQQTTNTNKTKQSPSFSQPWQMQAQTKCTASGFVIAPASSRRILTNAHAVANHVRLLLFVFCVVVA